MLKFLLLLLSFPVIVGAQKIPLDSVSPIKDAYRVEASAEKREAYDSAITCIKQHGGTVDTLRVPFSEIVFYEVDEEYFFAKSTYGLSLIGYTWGRTITIARTQMIMSNFLLYEHEFGHILTGQMNHAERFWMACNWQQ